MGNQLQRSTGRGPERSLGSGGALPTWKLISSQFTFLVELNLQPPPFLRGPQVGWRVSTLLLLGLSSDQPHHESPH